MTGRANEALLEIRKVIERAFEYHAPALYEDDVVDLEEAVTNLERVLGEHRTYPDEFLKKNLLRMVQMHRDSVPCDERCDVSLSAIEELGRCAGIEFTEDEQGRLL